MRTRASKRFVLRHRRTGEYYTVIGWTPGTCRSPICAVLFPNELLAQPQGPGWEKVPAKLENGFVALTEKGQ